MPLSRAKTTTFRASISEQKNDGVIWVSQAVTGRFESKHLEVKSVGQYAEQPTLQLCTVFILGE